MVCRSRRRRIYLTRKLQARITIVSCRLAMLTLTPNTHGPSHDFSPQQLCCGRCLPIRFIVLFFQQSLGAHFGRNVDNPLACPRSSSVRVCASLHAIRQLSFFVAASRTTYQSLSHREASFRAPPYDNLDNLAKCPCPPKPGL